MLYARARTIFDLPFYFVKYKILMSDDWCELLVKLLKAKCHEHVDNSLLIKILL